LPQFGDSEYDKKAIDAMKDVFPDKNVVGVRSKEVLLGGGNIHCITQQVPKIV
jgi:Peptidylarginine deiminase and related enzymes